MCVTPVEGKSPVIIMSQRKSSDQSTIPSPPLSPYQRSAELSQQTKSPIPISIIGSHLFKDDQQLVSRRFSKGEFPLEDLHNRSLSINAWNDVSSKNYKRKQLSFLNSYSSYRNSTASHGRVKKSYNTVPRTRRVYHHINSDVDSSSDFEKIRTRRVARETPVPTMDEVSSATPVSTTPVTPKKPRKPRQVEPSTPVYVDYTAIPDYSPSIDTLPNNNKCLRQEWKGQPMSLANDPLIGELHPAEVVLASTLRLPCAVYLDSKRRLFLEKVNRVKRGLPFRRTDAQKLCKIDVNKLSRLFAAFEKVNWLDDKHFKKYL